DRAQLLLTRILWWDTTAAGVASRGFRMQHISIGALLLALVLSAPTACAQKGNKPGRGGQGGNKPAGAIKEDGRDRREYELAAQLPPGFQQLRTDEVRQLEQFVNRALDWMRRTGPVQSGFESAVDLFQWQLAPAESGASSAEVRGLWILSLLNLDQRKMLASSLDDYRRLSGDRDTETGELTGLLATARSGDSPVAMRKLEADSRRSLQKVAEIDAELGILQSRVFVKVAKSLAAEQTEAILLAIGGTSVPATATPEMQAVQTELRNTSAEAARDLQELGVNLASWLAPQRPSGVFGAQLAPAESDRRGGGGRDKTVDPVLPEFLSALRSQQPELLLQLFSASVRRRGEAAAATVALQTALRPGSSAQVPDERTIRGLAQQRAQLVFGAAVEEARGFETLGKALSEVQRKHLKIEVDNQPKKKKTTGE
ncbi:MAG: hypothetical protein ACKOEO_22065, partial [Planctomycetaceae bacterium]